MQHLLETHRFFINVWESDENAHMNVQFYLRRFDEAARFFDMLSAGRSHDRPLPHDRHVRYHAELRAGSTGLVRSAVIANGPFQGRVVHCLENAETGVLAATALDSASDPAFSHGIAPEDVQRALPRSAQPQPLSPLAPDAILAKGGLVTNRSIVTPGECGADGRMSEQAHVARFSDAAPHTWHRAGVPVEWLKENGLGRVAVEMKITHHASARAGDPLALYSVPSASTGRTVTLRHEIVRMTEGTAIASGEVVALILDLATRKATRLPAAVAGRIASGAPAD